MQYQLNYLFKYVVLCSAILFAGNVQASADAQQVVRQAADTVISVLESEKEAVKGNPEKLYQLVKEHILPNFDFERMSYYVLGRAWKEASDTQKQSFIKEFEHLLVSTYAIALSEFGADEKIIFLPVQVSSNANIVVVPTEIKQKAGNTIAVAYRMYSNEGAWRIYDVAIDGVSLVTNYRASFAGQIRKGGMDGLLESMSTHNKPKTVVKADNNH